jgi:RNA polymerase sigma-70 factor (ECF subfamily)
MAAAHLIADDAVIERARALERDALGELWQIYHPQLLRFLRTKRADAVDDVASQVWIDVGRAIAGFVGGGREFQRWIFTIAHRRSVDEGRRSGRRRELLVDSRDHESADPRAPHPADAGVDVAIEMMAALPPQMAEAVMLRIVYELSVDETAEIMWTTAANVRVLTHRGLGKLRARLARLQPPPEQAGSAATDATLHAVPDAHLMRNV